MQNRNYESEKKNPDAVFGCRLFKVKAPDWAPREDGGDEWERRCKRGEAQRWKATAVSAEERLSLKTGVGVGFARSHVVLMSCVQALQHNKLQLLFFIGFASNTELIGLLL